MQVFKQPPEWNADAAARLQEVFEQPIVAAALANTAALRPTIDTSSLEKAGVSGAVARGYEMALQTLFSLTEKPAENTTNSERYPSIDDDSQWGELKKD